MNHDNQTPKEWAESIFTHFGRRKPVGIELRGSATGLHFNLSEIALIRIFHLTKKFGVQHDLQLDELVESQERSLYVIAGGFNLDIEPHLNQGMSNYEFIPRPETAQSYYSTGLADLMFVSDIDEIPFLLDFQHFNNVVAERCDEVKFLQLLHYYVISELKTRYPIVQTDKVALLQNWIQRHIHSLSSERYRQFYWYSEGYSWKHPTIDERPSESNETNDQNHTANDSISGLNTPLSIDDTTIEIEQKKTSGKVYTPILKYSCTKRELESYFGLLKQENPTKGEPMINPKAVEWIIGYYFEINGASNLSNKPDFALNISKHELMYFIQRFYTDVSPKRKGLESSTKPEVARILTECFRDLFGANPKSLSTRLKRETADLNNSVTQLIDSTIEKIRPEVSRDKPKGRGKRKVG